ncbi:hypothetical protein C2S52_013730 [Perilla frutescens var. hirtella]|nr:hypothetical protein C2S51_016005 [Perilla frutescens var. frutescens]KAH6776169.1 hypothetical protein C2S52_013730 [Perilla frutescens var. hirtella]
MEMNDDDDDSWREMSVEVARRAVETRRYEDAVYAMRSVVELNVKFLTDEERNLLIVGYKNMIASGRALRRALLSIEQKEKSVGNEENVQVIETYIQRVETNIDSICCEAKLIIEDYILPPKHSEYTFEGLVIYYRMLGDSSRYRAEIHTGGLKKKLAKEALLAYELGELHAQELSVANPIRLGLILNLSVFYYEISSTPECGRDIALMTYDSAMLKIERSKEELGLSKEELEESTRILKIMDTNLYLAAERFAKFDAVFVERIARIEAGCDDRKVEWKDTLDT